MAKKSKIAAEAKRREIVERYAARRAEIKELIRTAEPGSAEQAEAQPRPGRRPAAGLSAQGGGVPDPVPRARAQGASAGDHQVQLVSS
jgi:hypothetical protein